MAYITKRPSRSLRGLGSVNPMDPLTQFVSQWYPRPPVVESPARVEYFGPTLDLGFTSGMNVAPILGDEFATKHHWSVDLDDVVVSMEDAFVQPDGSCGNTGRMLNGPVPMVKLSAISSFVKFAVKEKFGLQVPTSSTKVLVGDGCDSTIFRLSELVGRGSFVNLLNECVILFTPSPSYPDATVGTWMLKVRTPFQVAVWGNPSRLQGVGTLVLASSMSNILPRAMEMYRAMRSGKPLVQAVNGVQYLTETGRAMLDNVVTAEFATVNIADLVNLQRASLTNPASVEVYDGPQSTDPTQLLSEVRVGGPKAIVDDYAGRAKPAVARAVEQAAQGVSPGPSPGPGPIVPVQKAEVTNVGPWILGAAVLGSAAWYWYSKKRGAR